MRFLKNKMKIIKIEKNEKGNKHYYIEPTEHIAINESNKIKAKRKGFKRPIKEIFNGFKPSKDKENFSKDIIEEMIIDREKNHYYQKVIDKNTNQVVHEEDESLSHHNDKKRSEKHD